MKEPESSPVARLIVTYQKKLLSVWEIPQNCSRIIGRGKEVHYQIKSGALSRRHCQITDTGTCLELFDLQSLNGTYVNRKKIVRSRLKNNDYIQIGPFTIKVQTIYQTDNYPTPIAKVPESAQREVPHTTTIEQLVAQAPEPNPNTGEKSVFSEYPSGNCLKCKKAVSAQDMSNHHGVYKGEQIYCLSCFCEGAGDFPTIAGYRIVKKLGGGGMGEVYEAIQLSMERPVAFKLMKGLENASEQQIRRFFREARTGGKLAHPNIVGFIDAGKLEGACYITMEFIYGTDVKQILGKQGPLPISDALRISYYVATALDYANSRFNIVHRDIKPENILVDRDQRITLTDFGLAKNLEEAGLSGITQSQTGVGTLFYMAPEQIANARFADHRADIYSLGISLYEMITGVRPFTANEMMALVNKIRHEPAKPITELVPEAPPKVWEIIEKSLAKKPEDRYQNAKELSKIIQSLIKEIFPGYML